VYGIVGTEGNFIYPDFPRHDLSDEKYPRIGYKITWRRGLAGLTGGSNAAFVNDGLLQIKVVALTTSEVTSMIQYIDNYMITNFKGFYYIRYIDPSSISNYELYDDNTQKPFAKVIEFNLPDKYQIG
jgi:hypothetical protein